MRLPRPIRENVCDSRSHLLEWWGEDRGTVASRGLTFCTKQDDGSAGGKGQNLMERCQEGCWIGGFAEAAECVAHPPIAEADRGCQLRERVFVELRCVAREGVCSNVDHRGDTEMRQSIGDRPEVVRSVADREDVCFVGHVLGVDCR